MFDDFWYFTITKLNGGYGATFYRWRCDTRISSNQKVHKINPETQTCPDPGGENMCWAMKWMFPGTICCPTKKKQHEKQGHTQRNVSRNTEREVDDYIINYPLKILKITNHLDDFGIPIAGLSQLGVTGDQVLLLIFIFPYPFPACAWDSDIRNVSQSYPPSIKIS